MMDDWKHVELGNICKIKGGKRLPKGRNLTERFTSHPYIRARDIRNGKINFDQPVYINEETYEKISRYVVNFGDVIITIVGANIGDTAFVTEKFDGANLTENAVKLVSNQDEVDPIFLKYALVPDYMKYYFQTVASGAAQDKLGIYKIKKIKLKLPPIPTQRKIASILSAYDDLIENNLKRIKLLEEKAQLTYEEWFVRMKFPGHKTTPINQETGFPEGWEKRESQRFFKISIGKTPPRGEAKWFNQSNGVKWVSIKDMRSASNFIYESNETISIAATDKFNFKFAEKDSVILSFKLTVGLVAIVSEKMTTNEAIAHFNPIKGIVIDKCYTYLYLKNFNYPSLGSTSSIGTAINSKIVKRISFILPDNDVRSRFTELVSPIFEIVDKINKQNQLLKEARDILLPRLMTGMIDVEKMNLETPQPATA